MKGSTRSTRTDRITYWSTAAERLTGFSAADVVGRRCRDGVLNHLDRSGRSLCIDRCPLRSTIVDGEDRQAHVLMHHADGHLQPVHVRARALRDPAGKIVGAVETFSDETSVIQVRQRMRDLEAASLTDALTGVSNRRGLMEALDRLLPPREHRPTGLLFIDIDHFKAVNDTHGHLVGDQVIRAVATTLAMVCRSTDHIARFGGEEFVVLLVDIHPSHLTSAADRLRVLVGENRIVGPLGPVQVRVSIGATDMRADDTPETLLRRADGLLYQAKNLGRDQTAADVGAW